MLSSISFLVFGIGADSSSVPRLKALAWKSLLSREACEKLDVSEHVSQVKHAIDNYDLPERDAWKPFAEGRFEHAVLRKDVFAELVAFFDEFMLDWKDSDHIVHPAGEFMKTVGNAFNAVINDQSASWGPGPKYEHFRKHLSHGSNFRQMKQYKQKQMECKELTEQIRDAVAHQNMSMLVSLLRPKERRLGQRDVDPHHWQSWPKTFDFDRESGFFTGRELFDEGWEFVAEQYNSHNGLLTIIARQPLGKTEWSRLWSNLLQTAVKRGWLSDVQDCVHVLDEMIVLFTDASFVNDHTLLADFKQTRNEQLSEGLWDVVHKITTRSHIWDENSCMGYPTYQQISNEMRIAEVLVAAGADPMWQGKEFHKSNPCVGQLCFYKGESDRHSDVCSKLLQLFDEAECLKNMTTHLGPSSFYGH